MSVIVQLSGTYSYAALKLAISDWLARSDIAEESADSFIDLAEARINRNLRVRAMETVYFRPLAADASSDVPTGFRQWKEAFLYRGGGTVDAMPTLANEVVSSLTLSGTAGVMDSRAASFRRGMTLSRIGTKFYVSGIPSGTYSLGGIYYKTFPALTDSNQTNWLTESAPDLLLSAVMLEAATYVKSQDEIVQWGERYAALLDEVQEEAEREKWSGPTIVTDLGVYDA